MLCLHSGHVITPAEGGSAYLPLEELKVLQMPQPLKLKQLILLAAGRSCCRVAPETSTATRTWA